MLGLLYDAALAPLEAAAIARLRRFALDGLSGLVLDVGAGTGVNLRHLPAGVRPVLADPAPSMLARAHGKDAAIVRCFGEGLPFRDGTFEAVIFTLVLCTARDP